MRRTILRSNLGTSLQLYIRSLYKSTLFMNAFYLMASTFVVAAAGLVFWIIVARSHDAATVGLATTMLSVSGLLSLLGLVGFDTTFVRFLPRSLQRDNYINSGFIIVLLASSGIAILVVIGLPLLSPNFSVLHGIGAGTSFVFFTAITALNILTNAVFLAHRQARSIFIVNAVSSVFKAAVPLVAAGGGAVTIFTVAGISQLIGLGLSVAWIKRKFGYKFSLRLHMDTVRVVKDFSLSVHFSSVLNLLPPTLLPLLIVHSIGLANAAYYYIAFALAGVLYTIAYASMQSVFAESSHDTAVMNVHISKVMKSIGIVLVPTALLTALLSGFLLRIFGQNYAEGATTLLQVFALGALPVALYSAVGAVFKVTKNLRGMVAMNVTYAVTILGLSYALVPSGGLVAVGWSWVIGNMAACGVGLFFVRRVKKEAEK